MEEEEEGQRRQDRCSGFVRSVVHFFPFVKYPQGNVSPTDLCDSDSTCVQEQREDKRKAQKMVWGCVYVWCMYYCACCVCVRARVSV